jgi:hypothetical protein
VPVYSSSRNSGFSGKHLKTRPELVSNCLSPCPSRRLSGNNVNIEPALQDSSVQSKIFANDSLDPVPRHGLPDFFRDGNAKARSRNLVFPGYYNEIVAVKTVPIFRQRPIFDGRFYSIRLGKPKSKR